jgi:phage N-6-adenine-methyltransferase
VSNYLCSLQTLVGNFVQVGPDGTKTKGDFYIQKPGKMRFEYDPPTPIAIIWGTPQDYFDKLNDEFGPFDLHVCAEPWNAKCPTYFTPEQDGLAQDWGTNICFMNPPFSEIERWMSKALMASLAGALVVCLIPNRRDTAWWHLCAAWGEPRDIRGRLKFLLAFTWRCMKSMAAADVSSSMVSIRFLVSGPLSSILPSANDFITPRGPNFLRYSGSVG